MLWALHRTAAAEVAEQRMNDRKEIDLYKAQAISTMTSEELMFLLFDELVKRLMRAELALEKKNYQLFEEQAQRSIDIIRYFDSTLDRQYPISLELSRLYEYFTYELGRSKIGRRAEPLIHVKAMIVDLRDTYRQAAKKVSERKPQTEAQH